MHPAGVAFALLTFTRIRTVAPMHTFTAVRTFTPIVAGTDPGAMNAALGRCA